MKEKKTASEQLKELATELTREAADIRAFMTGEIGPTQQEYIDKINSDWNGYNFIVQFGHVYKLHNEKKQKPNGALYCPCELCDLSEFCNKDAEETLCSLMQAETDEYFRDEGELIIDKRRKMKVEPW